MAAAFVPWLHRAMLVGTLCSRRPVSVSTGAPISDVARLMRDEHIGAVIVTESGRGAPRVVGMITDRDIIRAQLERAADLSRLSAGEVMTRNPLVIGEEESVDGAIAHLRARAVRRAPVVAVEGTLVGLISTDDLLLNVAHKLIGLAEIVGRQPRIERD
jgi:CBS domain-containing protein